MFQTPIRESTGGWDTGMQFWVEMELEHANQRFCLLK